MANSLQVFQSMLNAMQDLGLSKAQHPPLSRLPCANVQVSQSIVCKQPGTLKCSACKLVSYCSKNCQTSHWKRHKIACKDPMMRLDWMADWGNSRRLPSFVTEGTGPATYENSFKDPLGIGLSLWGNTPAIDLLNLSSNEHDPHRDYNIAFAASGDLRHVVKTVNNLPETFSGKLNIVINDLAPPTVCRNIALLLILATVSEETLAADVALHFWYSIFLPGAYQPKIGASLIRYMAHLVSNPHTPFKISQRSDMVLRAFAPQFKNIKETFQWYNEGSSKFELEDAQAEYDRVRNAPRRKDYRDRMYANLQPSHRVAFQLYRTFGMVLPFGAVNAHFNTPNYSLFSTKGTWWQTDYADPLEGWDIDKVVEAGKRHGATKEDIYGCLYFFLTEQLIEFTKRLASFCISFKFFVMDAADLATTIREDVWSDVAVPGTMRFDRIAVSNIVDRNYLGLKATVSAWSPLLAETKFSVIVGYFMNWFLVQKDGKCEGAGRKTYQEVIKRMNNHPYYQNRTKQSLSSLKTFEGASTMIFSSFVDLDVFYENSVPFEKYLKGEGIVHILRENGLKLRKNHFVVPHRLGVPVAAPATALPDFGDEDSWYLNLHLTSRTWAERFVELSRG